MNIWVRIAMYALSSIFILSGVSKAINIPAFAYEVRMYSDAYLLDGIGYWSQPIAVVVCALEIMVGLLALRSRYMKICSVAMLVMLSFFVWLTGINYFCPSVMGSIESCGCFGELIHFSPLGAFLKSVILETVVLCGCVVLWRCLKDWHVSMLMRDRTTYCALGSGLLLPLFSFFAFDNMEHVLYTTLYIAICVTLTLLQYACRRAMSPNIFSKECTSLHS